MGTFIPPRTDPYTGQNIFTTQARYDDLMSRYNADQSFQASFNQGIPGMNGTAYGGYAGIPLPGQGLQPGPGAMPPSRIPGQPPPQQGAPPMNQMFQGGPYAQQAMRMAGLLGNVSTPQQPTMGYQGLLGGPNRGFRIPGGK